MYKEIDIFGNEVIRPISAKKKKKNLFTDYESFAEKFVPKKTTDDCYTPKEIYSVIIQYLDETFGLSGKRILRPFYPGGDFEAIEYQENDIVIDNPPFSIVSKIAKFYIDRNIYFFIFSPHLTLFSAKLDCTYIVVGADIVYENKAKVKTSFLSNMYKDVKIKGDAELHARLEQASKIIREQNSSKLPKYKYPKNVLTVSMVTAMVERGVSISLHTNQVFHCGGLDSQKPHGKVIFGSGFLLSEKAAMEKAAMEKAAMEKDYVFYWELSEREKKIIESLR